MVYSGWLSNVCSNDNTEQREASMSHWSSEMEQMLLGKPGLGTRCMNTSIHAIEYATAPVFDYDN